MARGDWARWLLPVLRITASTRDTPPWSTSRDGFRVVVSGVEASLAPTLPAGLY
jgi:hypothetical protein